MSDSDSSTEVEDVASTYSRHIEEAQTILQEGSTSIETINRVRSLLQASSILSKKERCVQETILGGTALSLCAQIAKNQAQALDTNLCAFDPNSFSTGIINTIVDPEKNNGVPDWRCLARKVSLYFKRAPVFSYLYGSFKPTEPPPKVPKERKERQRRVADAADKKKPEKIVTVEASDQGNDQTLNQIKKILKKEFGKRNNEPMNYFECVLDPESFSHSIENIFNLSFLVRDNFIRVDNDSGKVPLVHLVSTQDAERYKASKKQQCIVSLNMAEWMELVNAFQIKTTMIPNQNNHDSKSKQP